MSCSKPFLEAAEIEARHPVIAGNRSAEFSVSGSPFKADYGLDEYQTAARSTAIYPKQVAVLYPVLGLTGEAGETAEKVRDIAFPAGCPKGWDPVTEVEKQVYHALNANAIAGRECERVKKVLRDKKGELPAGLLEALERRMASITGDEETALVKELGDVAWYQAGLAGDIGVRLSDVARENIAKLQSRKERGVLTGSGDNR
jgi:hypothetical protein